MDAKQCCMATDSRLPQRTHGRSDGVIKPTALSVSKERHHHGLGVLDLPIRCGMEQQRDSPSPSAGLSREFRITTMRSEMAWERS